MGREVRRVPPEWVHPESPDGGYIPLFDNLSAALARWHQECAQWQRGYTSCYPEGWDLKSESEIAQGCADFAEWSGECPDPADYMPDWPREVRTHLQMYETCSEGTPISPVMKSPEELARWLADNNASAFGNMGASYEQWLSIIKRGWAVSAVGTMGKGLVSGVEGLHQSES